MNRKETFAKAEKPRSVEVPAHKRWLSPNFLPSEKAIEMAKDLGVNIEVFIVDENNGILGRVGESNLSNFVQRFKKARSLGSTFLADEVKKLYEERSAGVVWTSQPSGPIAVKARTVVRPHSRKLSDLPATRGEEEDINMSEVQSAFGDMLEAAMAGNVELTEKTKFEQESIEGEHYEYADRGEKEQPETKRQVSSGREFALKLGRAHRDISKWQDPEFVAEYMERFKTLPAYYEYRVAAYDLLKRVIAGEVDPPRKILSVASGPLEEVEVHAELMPLYEKHNIPPPKVYSLDASLEMLKQGKTMIDQIEHETREDKVSHYEVVGDFENLPIAESSFDVVEFSTLHGFNFEKEQDVRKLFEILRSIHGILKDGGILRIVHYRRLPDSFFNAFKTGGWELITSPHSRLSLGQLSETPEKTTEFISRKLKNNKEYILARKAGAAGDPVSDDQIKDIIEEEQKVGIFQMEIQQGVEVADIEERLRNVVLARIDDKFASYIDRSMTGDKRREARRMLEDILKLKIVEGVFNRGGRAITGTELLHDLAVQNLIHFRDSRDIKPLEQHKRYLENQISQLAKNLFDQAKQEHRQVRDEDIEQRAKRLMFSGSNPSALYSLLSLSDLLEKARELRMDIADQIFECLS